MEWRRYYEWILTHSRILSYFVGSLLISIWTLLRFFDRPLIFDQVAQQVIVHQWLHGNLSTAHMGMTAYIPKMLLVYVPVDLLPGSPRLKLVLVTLVINLVSFILLGLLLERVLRLFKIKPGQALYLGLIWLAAIAGSVFWIGFVNSRNIEVVGGVAWLYGGLLILQKPRWQHVALLSVFGMLLFFDDPLQLYMSGAPLLLYGFVLALRRSLRLQTYAKLIAATIIAYAGSELLFAILGPALHLTFTDTGGTAFHALSIHWIADSASGTIRAIASLFEGGSDAGKVREVINLLLFAVGISAILYALIKRHIQSTLGILLYCIVLTDIAIYVVTGQATQGSATNRYLIMLAPAALLAFGTIPLRTPSRRQLVIGGGVIALGLNGILLLSTLATHWDTSFPKDAHIASTYRYMSAHPGMQVYASDDTAMTTLFLHNESPTKLLPVGCLNGSLVRTYYSMDDAFATAGKRVSIAAIVLDGTSVTNAPNLCTADSIRQQFGEPKAMTRTDDGSIVLLYPQARIRLP